jgi:large subunit ribosomal protein L32
MAVPKKKTSKSKRDIRKSNWKNKASIQARKALAIAFSLLKRQTELKTTNFSEKSSGNNEN